MHGILSEDSGLFKSVRDYVACRWLLPVEAFIRTAQLGSILLLAATAAALADQRRATTSLGCTAA